MSNINSYLPQCLNDIYEFNVINSSLDIELENIEKNINYVGDEIIINKATLIGVEQWEKTLGIIPTLGDSLDIRKFRISNILLNKLPYTKHWLRNKLVEITGSESAFLLSIDNSLYKITIILSGLDPEIMAEVQKQLRYSIPANMELEIGGESVTTLYSNYGMGTYLVSKYKFRS